MGYKAIIYCWTFGIKLLINAVHQLRLIFMSIWKLPSIFFLCRNANETVRHLFSECSFMIDLYKMLKGRMSMQNHDSRTILKKEEAQNCIVRKGGERRCQEILLIAMFVWCRERCTRIFKDQIKPLPELAQEVRDI